MQEWACLSSGKYNNRRALWFNGTHHIRKLKRSWEIHAWDIWAIKGSRAIIWKLAICCSINLLREIQTFPSSSSDLILLFLLYLNLKDDKVIIKCLLSILVDHNLVDFCNLTKSIVVLYLIHFYVKSLTLFNKYTYFLSCLMPLLFHYQSVKTKMKMNKKT